MADGAQYYFNNRSESPEGKINRVPDQSNLGEGLRESAVSEMMHQRIISRIEERQHSIKESLVSTISSDEKIDSAYDALGRINNQQDLNIENNLNKYLALNEMQITREEDNSLRIALGQVYEMKKDGKFEYATRPQGKEIAVTEEVLNQLSTSPDSAQKIAESLYALNQNTRFDFYDIDYMSRDQRKYLEQQLGSEVKIDKYTIQEVTDAGIEIRVNLQNEGNLSQTDVEISVTREEFENNQNISKIINNRVAEQLLQAFGYTPQEERTTVGID